MTAAGIRPFFLQICFCWTLLAFCIVPSAMGQGRATEYIRGADANGNGLIEPNEISDRARPYMERYAEAGRISMYRTNSIGRWEYAIRRYYENQSSDSNSSPSLKPSSVLGFEPASDAPLIPGFGATQIKYPYTAADLDDADSSLRRYDDNGDGALDRNEAADGRWTRGNPFDYDFNRDGRVSRLELAQRYARRRIAESMEGQARYSPIRSEPSNDSQEEAEERFRRSSSRSNSNSSSRYLADSIMDRNDRNRDDRLDINERAGLGIDDAQADLDLDGDISEDELSAWYYQQMMARANDLTDVLPTWFFERDMDNDGQVAMAEFTDAWDQAKVDEFEALDANRDGIITSNEMLTSVAVVGGSFSSQKAQIIAPRATVVSEIEVTEDYMIGDLNIQLSITHTYTEQLDAYLIGPDGQRIELFTGVGRSDDNFEKTILDDEAGRRIREGRPPFDGSYQPEAVEKRQPSLGSYKKKNSERPVATHDPCQPQRSLWCATRLVLDRQTGRRIRHRPRGVTTRRLTTLGVNTREVPIPQSHCDEPPAGSFTA
jgi:Ca2+-binding EF-hand superfamily protein